MHMQLSLNIHPRPFFLLSILSGTPADCVSLEWSGAMFAWPKPLLVSVSMNVPAYLSLRMSAYLQPNVNVLFRLSVGLIKV